MAARSQQRHWLQWSCYQNISDRAFPHSLDLLNATLCTGIASCRKGRARRNRFTVASAPALIAFRRTSRIGDLDPAIFCAPFVAAIVGDGFGFAVALGREPVRCDAVLREPRRHRLPI